MAPRADSLIGSAIPRKPAARSSMATKTVVSPPWRCRSTSIPELARVEAPLGQELRVPDRDRPPIDGAHDAPARQGLEVRDRGEREPLLLRRPDDGRRQRVLARPFEGRGQAEQLVGISALGGDDGDDPRLPLGEGAGLIHHHRIDLPQGFEGLGVLEEDARHRPPAGADHDGHGGREPQGAGAGDDEHRDRVEEGIGEPRLGPEDGPDDEGQGRDRQDDRHEVGRDDVGQALDRGAGPLGLAHHPHDLGEHRLGAHPLGPHDEAPGAVDRAADEGRPGRLRDGDRLAGDHRLVDGARAFEDHAVGRDLLARPDAEPVADLDQVEGDVLFAPVVAESAGHLGGEAQERLDGARRPAPGLQFEHLAEQDEGRDDRRRLEVDGHHAAVPAERGRDEAGEEGRHDAVAVGDPRPEGDEREHVEASVHDRGPAALEERPAAPEDDGRREGELDPERDVRRHEMPHGRDHLAHREDEDRERQDEARPRTGGSCRRARDWPRRPRQGTRGSRAMPQMGQLPGPSRTISGCIGQV